MVDGASIVKRVRDAEMPQWRQIFRGGSSAHKNKSGVGLVRSQAERAVQRAFILANRNSLLRRQPTEKEM
jgi:hypothetical protein